MKQYNAKVCVTSDTKNRLILLRRKIICRRMDQKGSYEIVRSICNGRRWNSVAPKAPCEEKELYAVLM